MTDLSLTGNEAEVRSAPVQRLRAKPDSEIVPTSFSTLYEQYFDFVWRSLRRLGVPVSALDDAAQEVFMVVHRRLPEFEGRASLKTWLFGIALNVAQHVMRSAARRASERAPETLTAPVSTPQEEFLRAEAVKLLYQVLDELDPDKRSVFVMAELEQMTASEISELSGLPLNTVYSRLRLARRDFEAALKRYRARDAWRLG
jgi:RNA polymerase sigma-70 factor, ECF subfamily